MSAGFKSYVDFDKDNSNELDDGIVLGETPTLLKGETIVASCKIVTLLHQFTEGKQSTFGSLFCTDLRLSFVSIAHVSNEVVQRSTVFPTLSDVALGNIHLIHIKKNDKFKLLTSALSITDTVSALRITTKDFRVLTYEFTSAIEPHTDREVINAVFHYAFPQRFDRFFSLTHHWEAAHDHRWLIFNSKDAWAQELLRTGASKLETWRISQLNSNFAFCESYPEVCVVPRCLLDNVIAHTAGNWALNRFPVWCWSSREGAALLRCSDIDTVSEMSHRAWKSFSDGIKAASFHHKSDVNVCDIDLPFSQIQTSFSALLKLCTVDSCSQFWLADVRWRTDLENSAWLIQVQRCLNFAIDVLQNLQNKNSVVIKENNGRDTSCVVASIVQICADPFFRTMEGFKVLIAKEWIGFGHQFSLRLHGLESSSTSLCSNSVAPVFLMFLDCVFQLLQQFPTSFEYTYHFLIALWDMALSTLNGALLLNSVRECKQYSSTMSCPWALSSYFTSTYRRCFRNPLFYIDKGHKRFETGFLTPNSNLGVLEFWLDCYGRWCPAVQNALGGRSQQLLAEMLLVADVLRLRQTVKHMKLIKTGYVKPSPEDADENRLRRSFEINEVMVYHELSSGFPYTASVLKIPDRTLIVSLLKNSESRSPTNQSLPPERNRLIGRNWYAAVDAKKQSSHCVGLGRSLTFRDTDQASPRSVLNSGRRELRSPVNNSSKASILAASSGKNATNYINMVQAGPLRLPIKASSATLVAKTQGTLV